jgi:hypothetical protein
MTLALVLSSLLFIALTALLARQPQSVKIRANREEERDASSDLP